ncbi:MAG: rod-binding protein [Pseudomonadota bacterium]
MTLPIPTGHSLSPSPGPDPRDALRAQATKLESFLFAELLRVSNTGNSSLVGGGESQFHSLLREQQAEAVAGSGQTGLAEAIYRALAKENGLPPGLLRGPTDRTEADPDRFRPVRPLRPRSA